MFLVKCPKCKHDMKYQPTIGDITKKKKKCVYCNHTFLIHSNLDKSRIVKKIS